MAARTCTAPWRSKHSSVQFPTLTCQSRTTTGTSQVKDRLTSAHLSPLTSDRRCWGEDSQTNLHCEESGGADSLLDTERSSPCGSLQRSHRIHQRHSVQSPVRQLKYNYLMFGHRVSVSNPPATDDWVLSIDLARWHLFINKNKNNVNGDNSEWLTKVTMSVRWTLSPR